MHFATDLNAIMQDINKKKIAYTHYDSVIIKKQFFIIIK